MVTIDNNDVALAVGTGLDFGEDALVSLATGQVAVVTVVFVVAFAVVAIAVVRAVACGGGGEDDVVVSAGAVRKKTLPALSPCVYFGTWDQGSKLLSLS